MQLEVVKQRKKIVLLGIIWLALLFVVPALPQNYDRSGAFILAVAGTAVSTLYMLRPVLTVRWSLAVMLMSTTAVSMYGIGYQSFHSVVFDTFLSASVLHWIIVAFILGVLSWFLMRIYEVKPSKILLSGGVSGMVLFVLFCGIAMMRDAPRYNCP